jgi:uncharacterized protein
MLELGILLVSGAVGAALAGLLKLPMWPITGAILGSAAASLLVPMAVEMPTALSFFAQVLVGTAVGASVLPGFLKQLGALLVPAIVVVLSLVALAISAGALLSVLGLVRADEAVLGMIPGGVGEMVAASAALGADSALVAGIHLIRLLLLVWTLPLLVRWAAGWRRPGEPDDPDEAATR